MKKGSATWWKNVYKERPGKQVLERYVALAVSRAVTFGGKPGSEETALKIVLERRLGAAGAPDSDGK